MRPGLRLFAVPAENIYRAGNFLSQKMQHRDFDMDVPLVLHGRRGDRAGVGVMGYEYRFLSLGDGCVTLVSGSAREMGRWTPASVGERTEDSSVWTDDRIFLRMRVREGMASFFFGRDEASLRKLGKEYPLSRGGWTGARPGICAINILGAEGGWADFASVTVTPFRENDTETEDEK